MEEKKRKMQLPKITRDEFFTTQEERDFRSKEHIENIRITEIEDFPNHPFKVIVNDEMIEMSKSIVDHGVLVPVLVRPRQDGKYEMISGHRRKKASELANKETIPCIIREMTDDEAIIVMVDSNMQRENILPSEKAFAYKLKLEALSHQGKRTDLTLSQLGTKLRTDELIGEDYGDSRNQVQRYIRLTRLIPKLLEMVDNEVLREPEKMRMALSPAVELSFLTRDEQQWVLDNIEQYVATPSHAQAIKMKKLSQSGKLTQEIVEDMMCEEKPNQVEKIKFNAERLRNLLPKNLDDKGREDYVVKAVEFYNNHQRKRQMER